MPVIHGRRQKESRVRGKESRGERENAASENAEGTARHSRKIASAI